MEGQRRQKKQEKFRPAIVRQALNNHGGTAPTYRGQLYKLMCNYAAHPAYEGFMVIAPKGLGNVGPFFEATRLRALVEQFAKHLPFFAVVYMRHFDSIPHQFLKLDFLNNLKPWAERYLNVDLKDAILDEINELIRCI